jgi:mRNA-degrading endonuclease toxin of MazEF toxin-antitoxin module
VSIQPGEIRYWRYADGGPHRVLIVSREGLNRGSYVVGIPFTSRSLGRRRQLPNCVWFTPQQAGVDEDCVAQAEQVTFIPISELDEEILGVVGDEGMRDVIRAIGNVIAADCEGWP